MCHKVVTKSSPSAMLTPAGGAPGRSALDDPCPQPPVSRGPTNRGIVAGTYLLACLVAGIGLGALLGSLAGALAAGVILGVFVGFFAGIAVVRSRFGDL